MTLEEAFESRIGCSEAIDEIAAHGLFVDFDTDGEIFDPTTGETIVRPGRDGLYPGGVILAWLGY